jgi:cell division protein FtsI (penicillin-binding protein 3)/stage V sporulation protein D (sporulation-specific penicillin-binding protein)
MRDRAIVRIRVITALVLLLSLGLLVRVYFLQIMGHDYYVAQANEQYVHTAQNIYDRGTISFTTKDGAEVSAAAVRSGYVLAVNPNLLSDPKTVYEQISDYIDIDEETFLHRATLPERTYVEIDTEVTRSDADTIKKHDFTGVMLYRNQWRYYPGDDLSAQTIGFTGYADAQAETPEGLYGLERYYNHILRRDDESLSVNFFAEIFANLGKVVDVSKNQQEGDVVTHIEPTVARMLEQKLHQVQDTFGAKRTGGIIMDPRTGAIHAMGVVPGYNNNDRSDVTIEQFRNPLVEDVYEFGSIIKALTMAAGIDAGAVSPSTTYYDAGSKTLDGYTIRNYDGRGRGTVSMQEVLKQSLNTGVAFIVETMGIDAFRDYFSGLKLGTETGVDLPNEARGLVRNLESPRKIEYATASYGQGIAMTPIATIRALATLANGGQLVTPHIAKRVEYENGEERVVTFPEGDQVFSAATTETVSRMLTTVVDEALAGGDVALPHYTVAAKTGTAQIPDPGGGYYDDRYFHSFFGYFPAYEPRFIVLLYTVEPQEVRYASETLTDPFMDITSFLLNYYEIPPDR